MLIFGAAFAAYDYFGAPVGEKIIFKNLNKGAPTPITTETVKSVPQPDVATLPPETPAPKATPTVPTPTPSPTAAPTMTTKVEEVKAEPNGFVPPKHESIEDLTLNWTKIPPSAFPRPVKLLKDTLFKMSVGGSTLAAGAQAVAVGFQSPQLLLAPTPTSPARAVVALEDTDFKNSIIDGYEIWKQRRTDALRKLHAKKLASSNASETQLPAPSGGQVSPDGKPVSAPDGSYPLLIAHLQAADLTELKANKISRWSDPEPTNHEGKPAWAIKVNAEVNSIFGPQPVDILCIVKNGRVEGWYYAGSGEPVP